MSANKGNSRRLEAAPYVARVEDTKARALALIGRVRELDAAGVHAQLGRMTRDQLEGVAVVLASMVSDDDTVAILADRVPDGEAWLVWQALHAPACDPLMWGKSAGSRALHGTRSRYNAGCRGEACRAAEAAYTAERARAGKRPRKGQTSGGG